jgi:hypothetical protein
MNQLRPAGLHLRYAILAGVLSLIAARSSEATVLKNVTLTEQGSLTMLTIEADVPSLPRLLLSNPDRLVLERQHHSLPPRIGAEKVGDTAANGGAGSPAGPVRTAIRLPGGLRADGPRLVFDRQRSNGSVVILENGTSSSGHRGQDRFRR